MSDINNAKKLAKDIAEYMIGNYNKFCCEVPNYASSTEQFNRFLKQHPKIKKLLDWYTGEKIIDNYHGGQEEFDERRSNPEQVAFVINKLQEDPELLQLAHQFCSIMKVGLDNW